MKMKTTNYITLKGEEINIEDLPSGHKEILREVAEYFKESPDWNDFSNFWLGKMRILSQNGNRKELARSPLFRVFQDMASRLGINQGYMRLGDYRDYLAMIIDRDFPSRYAFCQKTGLNEAFLSHILKKEKNLSISKLQDAMNKAGYNVKITFERKTTTTLSV